MSTTFEYMKFSAIRISEAICVDDENGNSSMFHPEWWKLREGRFNIDGKAICFIEGKCLYVLPNCSEYEEILIYNGFLRDEEMYVPFSSGSFPVKKKREWILTLPEVTAEMAI